MANELRDHVWHIDTTANLAVDPPGEQRIHLIRWIPGTTAATASLARRKEDGTFEVVWEDNHAGASDLPAIESHVDLRLTKGMQVAVAGAGTRLYLYLALDNQN